MRTRKHFGSTRQLLAVIILTHLSWCHTWGLNPDANVDHLLVDQWKMADGIPSDTILSITQTPDGYLWIAAARGLVRFDGIKFSTIPLTGSEKDDPRKTIIPDTLMVDRAGTLWIGTTGGLISYHSKTRQFGTFTSADGLTSDRFRRIQEDMNGNLWISFFASHVNRFANGKFTAFNANHGLGGNKINAIVEDRKGQLLFGDREKGVFKYKNGKFFKYPVPGLERHQIITMHEDQEGDLWIGSNKGLFRVYNNSVQRYTTGDGLSHDYIIDIKEDREHVLWIAAQNGLNRIKKKQNGTLLIESLLTTFSLTCLYKDMEDNLWAGTYNSGILRIKDSKFISYAPLEALQETFLLSLFQDRKGDTWIGSLNGQLFRCRDSSFTESPLPPELSGTGIAAISQDNQENLWLGTNGKGVFQKKKEIFIQYTTRDGLSDNLVTSIYKDTRGSMWFGTYDGVSVHRYPGSRIESFNSRDGLTGKKVHNIYEDKNGDTWIAADNGITVLKQGKLKKENASFYLQGVTVTCIYEDPSPPNRGERIYWIATHGEGLKRLRLKDRTVTSYTTVEGMTTNIIFQFFEDRQENFWLMSDNGILRVSKSELHRFASGTRDKINCISFGISDGLKSLEFNNEFSRHSALKTRTGELWFITKKGISIVNPDEIHINKTPPPVVIEAAFFQGQPMPLSQYVVTRTIKGKGDFEVHFTAPTFLSPGKVKFKYRLEGLEKDWVFLLPGKEREAHYRDLEPGTYTFNVTACNAEGVWNPTGAFITFTIKPFYYQTFLFKIAVLLLAAVLLIAAFHIRKIHKKRSLEKREEEKYKGSPLDPHFAGECIKILNYLIEVEKVYHDEEITLTSLAEKLASAGKIYVPPHLLSRVLNEKLGHSFSDFINSHRIEEAKKILGNFTAADKKISAVAQEVGFNSIAAFYKAFKKFTGMKPTECQKGAGQKK